MDSPRGTTSPHRLLYGIAQFHRPIHVFLSAQQRVDDRVQIGIVLPIISNRSMSVLQIDMAPTGFHFQRTILPV
jgi:hypothetical protein